MTRDDSADSEFAFEVAKVLLHAVWADGEVADEEAEAVHDYAVRAGVTPAGIEALDACLVGQSPLPAPNLGLLRPRRTEVLRAVKELLLSDLEVANEENEILSQIAALLG
jgi:uncharacterized tellurite resistance protein B-like protein